MKHFGVFINPMIAQKQSVHDMLATLRESMSLQFYGMPEQASCLPDFVQCGTDLEKRKPPLDCILVFGGDGTIMRAKRMALLTKAPILGINIGNLGFLSESTLQDLKKSIRELKNNHYKIQTRMLLQVTLRRQGQVVYHGLALNDAVVYKAVSPRLMEVRVYSNRRLVIDTRCDGIVCSSPTGSTAYSLSAGGPILSPVMEAMVVSPLNPHILGTRPMVFPASDVLGFSLLECFDQAVLQIDGENVHELHNLDEILITAAPQKISFIKLSNRTFYQILRKKMHMGKL